MEFVLLILAAILIGKYIKKRSPAVTIAHTMFFVVIFYLSFFTTDFAPIAQFTKDLFGMEYYHMREAMCEPCVWIYSTNLTIFVVELLLFLLVQVGTVVEVVKFLKRTGEKEYRRKMRPCFDRADVPARFVRTEEKIFLNKCSLLI